jgi:pyridoxal phosphate enzyme (YggS family)
VDDLTAGRRAEIIGNLRAVRARIAAACDRAGRDPADVVLVAVTKTFPPDDIRHLAELGVGDVGESRDQEASAKHAALADVAVRWHFVGRLQTNKCKSVASYADVVHSLDRSTLVDALDRAVRAGHSLDVFVQVSLDTPPVDPSRGGAAPDDIPALCAAVDDAAGLRLVGVMAVAPYGVDPAPAFARLADLAADVRSAHPGATAISAGMTGDLEAAIAAGATHVRVGTALLGGRPPLVR